MSQRSAALTVSWPCSLPPQDCSGPRPGLRSWSEMGRDAPPGPRADGTVSGADVDSQGSQSVFWPAAMHSAALRDRGLAQCGAHLTTIPHLTPAALPKTHRRAGAAALPQASPGWCSVVLCGERVTHTALRARAPLLFVLEKTRMFPVICQNIESVEAGTDVH